MKNIRFTFLGFFILSMFFTSCLKDKCDELRTFVEYEAIYVQPQDFRVNPSYISERKMENPGKIYYYNDILMINEKYEGIHLFDNSDASNPVNIGFITIPGNLDVAVKGNTLYADNYTDLLTIDISQLNNPSLITREEEVFNLYPFQESLGYYIYTKETPNTIEVDCGDPNFDDTFFWRNEQLWAESGTTFDSNGAPNVGGSTDNGGNTGVGGSFARFSVINDYLYVLNARELKTFNISSPSHPNFAHSTHVDWGDIETLYAYQSHLFIGGNAGMFIYSMEDPAAPSWVSTFRHARACDPVFVKDDIAYVTLRDGSACESFTNQLDVIDISAITSPQLIESYDMSNPHGLAVRDNNLYICEGNYGLKVFNNEDLKAIDENQLSHLKDIHAYDIISLSSDHIMVVGDDGLYQYDSSDPSNMKSISFIPIDRNL